MKRNFALWTVVAFCLISPVQAEVFECRRCSDIEYLSRARAVGIGEHLVYDFARENLKHFQVDCPGVAPTVVAPGTSNMRSGSLERIRAAAMSASSCPRPLRAIVMPIDPAYQDSFGRALAFYKAAGRDDTLGVALDMNDVAFADVHIRDMSAYDIVSSVNARQQFADWLHSGHELPLSAQAEAAMTGVLQDVLGALFNGSLEVLITVTFRDGTSVQYEWQLSSNSLAAVPESGRADGNVIPDELDRQAQGTYRFSGPDAAQTFVNWLIGQGIPVSYSTQPFMRVTCSWDGHELSCHSG